MATASVTNSFVTGATILAASFNTNFSDLVGFLNNSVVHRDGSKTMSGNLAMGSNKITGLAAGTVAGDAVRFEQLTSAPRQAVVFGQSGEAVVTTVGARFYFDKAVTIDKVEASVSVAPTDASLIVDVHKNGTTIFTTQGNRPAILTTAFFATQGGAPEVTAIADGDYLQVQIDQIGSTLPGEDVVVTVWYTEA